MLDILEIKHCASINKIIYLIQFVIEKMSLRASDPENERIAEKIQKEYFFFFLQSWFLYDPFIVNQSFSSSNMSELQVHLWVMWDTSPPHNLSLIYSLFFPLSCINHFFFRILHKRLDLNLYSLCLKLQSIRTISSSTHADTPRQQH